MRVANLLGHVGERTARGGGGGCCGRHCCRLGGSGRRGRRLVGVCGRADGTRDLQPTAHEQAARVKVVFEVGEELVHL